MGSLRRKNAADVSPDYWQQVRAVNYHFLEYCTKLVKTDPFIDLRKVCTSLISHRDNIDKLPSPATDVAPIAISATDTLKQSIIALSNTSKKRSIETTDTGDSLDRKKTSFTFGSTPPTFSFGTNSVVGSTQFAFGKAPDNASAMFPAVDQATTVPSMTSTFSFGSGSNDGKSQTSSAFTFGPPAHSTSSNDNSKGISAPSTAFSSQAINAAPFSFSTTMPISADASKAPAPFSFMIKNSTPSAPAITAQTSQNLPTEALNNSQGNADEEDTDNAPKYTTDPELTRRGAGEENELTAHEVRTSVSILRQEDNGKSDWEKMGVGTLKINIPVDGSAESKPRLLMRLDGNGRVAINSLLTGVVLGAVNGKRVFMGIAREDGKLEQHAALVKSAELAMQLHAAIKNHKEK